MSDNVLEALNYLDPAELSYQEWANVGMALKQEGYSCAVWDDWSRNDHRYHPGECVKKWNSFRGNSSPVAGGTIVQMARERGFAFGGVSRCLDWDDVIAFDGIPQLVDRDWLEVQELHQPAFWDPVRDLIIYLETLFDSTDLVGYVTDSWEKDGKYLPTSGSYDRTAGQLIAQLSGCNGDLGAVLGDYKTEAGAWIRFNPLDGQGVRNTNVTDFRYALVESDSMPIEEQNAAIRKMELPVACLVHSGGKSLHAIVRVDAPNYEEYRKRVDYLYEVCRKNGLEIDRQNRNPSRLSRMPGVTRKGNRQWLVDTNIGKESWAEWKEWIEAINDNLPDEEDELPASELPPKAPPLIEGVLLQGHKMLLSGPSKAGKSFALIELAIAIAEGVNWLGFPCARGKVLYVNLELDRASCLHRFADVRAAMGVPTRYPVKIWNLRGHSCPMDQLAPKLIRRAAKENYIAIIIDPIYKIITGDENSADQMAAFCNQFDKVATELGCAVIYCHHHSKGAQGGKKSMDRASGSGVFARDPDAILDMIGLEIPDSLLLQQKNEAACGVIASYLDDVGALDEVSQDDLCSRPRMLEAAGRYLHGTKHTECMKAVTAAEKACEARTGWRLSSSLREFPPFPPVDLWFDYPVHRRETQGLLKDAETEGEQQSWKKNFAKSGKKSKSKEDRAKEREASLNKAFDACQMSGKTTVADLAEYLGKSDDSVRRIVKASEIYWIDKGVVHRKADHSPE